MKIEKLVLLKDGEEVIEVFHRYFIPYVPRVVLIFLWTVAPFFFLFFLFRQGLWGVLLFVFVLGAGVFYGLRQMISWNNNLFLVTNKRVIDLSQVGLFDRTVSEAPLKMIDDVSWRIKGVFPTVFHYGNVVVRNAGNAADIEVVGIKNPQVLHDLVNDLRIKYKKKKSRKKKKLDKLMKKMTDEEIEMLSEKIKVRQQDEALETLYGDEIEEPEFIKAD